MPSTAAVSDRKAKVLLFSTDDDHLSPLVRSLASQLCAAGVPAELSNPSQLEEDSGAFPNALCLALVGLPVKALLTDGGENPVQDTLDTWALSVRRLLQLARRDPERWLILQSGEALRNLPVLAQLLARHLGLQVPPPLREEGPAPDSLLEWLAQGLLQSQPGMRRLQEELHAQSVALEDVASAGGSAPWGEMLDRHLGLLAEIRKLRCDAQAAATELDRASAALQSLESQKRQLESREQGSREEARQLLLQLHGAQEQLEREFLQRQQVNEELSQARAELSASKKASEAQANALRSEIEAARRETSPKQELVAAKQEQDLLLLQLHQLQEELELQFLQWQERDASLLAHVDGIPVSVKSADPGEANEGQPHRHIAVQLQDLRIGDRRWPRLELRLVEHAQQPGLLFWAPSADSPSLSAWQANGEEGTRPFMLLIPRTAQGRASLERLGSLDWQLVQGVARVLLVSAAAAPQLWTTWHGIAAKLVRELDQMPVRLRYDSAIVTPAEGDEVAVHFSGAQFGTLPLGELQLRWWPNQERVHWLVPDDPGQVPLASWPTGPDGSLARFAELPCGSGAAERRRLWAALPDGDQALLLALLDALPGAAIGPGMDGMVHRAVQLHRQARKTQRTLQTRSLLRRALRRLRLAR